MEKKKQKSTTKEKEKSFTAIVQIIWANGERETQKIEVKAKNQSEAEKKATEYYAIKGKRKAKVKRVIEN